MSNVRCDIQPPLALITLDRPQALNALDLSMVRDVREALERARDDERVRAVVVTGAGGRAFCAGGDVRGVVLDHRARGTLSRAFFLEEYALNHAIARFGAGARGKPWISLLDGIVMGGGAGIAVHGSHRVATERTLFAMPETAIGFFPDVGASFFLARCPGELGTWLGLTGARIGAADLLAAGLATHVVDAAALAPIVAELARALADLANAGEFAQRGHAVVERVLAVHARTPPPSTLTPAHRDVVDRCFVFDGMAEILAALAARARAAATAEDGAFAAATLATLRAMSPTSLVATLALLRAGRSRTLEQALEAEYRASQAFAGAHDFDEGVRAMLIDKDKTPVWNPARVEYVDEARVRAAIEQAVEPELVLAVPRPS